MIVIKDFTITVLPAAWIALSVGFIDAFIKQAAARYNADV